MFALLVPFLVLQAFLCAGLGFCCLGALSAWQPSHLCLDPPAQLQTHGTMGFGKRSLQPQYLEPGFRTTHD